MMKHDVHDFPSNHIAWWVYLLIALIMATIVVASIVLILKTLSG
jgi:hypothetical protein